MDSLVCPICKTMILSWFYLLNHRQYQKSVSANPLSREIKRDWFLISDKAKEIKRGQNNRSNCFSFFLLLLSLAINISRKDVFLFIFIVYCLWWCSIKLQMDARWYWMFGELRVCWIILVWPRYLYYMYYSSSHRLNHHDSLWFQKNVYLIILTVRQC
jgi:hypothetical protein